jgi:hypothetical protein
MEYILNNSKTIIPDNLEEIKVDNIPICNGCLFEIKQGLYLCGTCKENTCEVHIKKHSINKHKIIKLIKND